MRFVSDVGGPGSGCSRSPVLIRLPPRKRRSCLVTIMDQVFDERGTARGRSTRSLVVAGGRKRSAVWSSLLQPERERDGHRAFVGRCSSAHAMEFRQIAPTRQHLPPWLAVFIPGHPNDAGEPARTTEPAYGRAIPRLAPGRGCGLGVQHRSLIRGRMLPVCAGCAARVSASEVVDRTLCPATSLRGPAGDAAVIRFGHNCGLNCGVAHGQFGPLGCLFLPVILHIGPPEQRRMRELL